MTENKMSGYLLFLVSRAHHNLANKVFGEIGLFRGQPSVLLELGVCEGVTQTVLAEKLELTQATLTNLLNRLEQAGLIIRSPDPRDSRCSRIHLTVAGRQKLEQSREQTRKIDQCAFEGFSPEDNALFDEYLHRIHQNLTR